MTVKDMALNFNEKNKFFFWIFNETDEITWINIKPMNFIVSFVYMGGKETFSAWNRLKFKFVSRNEIGMKMMAFELHYFLSYLIENTFSL